MGEEKIDVVMKNMMEKIGLKKFYIKGGEWGEIIE
jgi:hypothetical protein